jgi:hypothetical protein
MTPELVNYKEVMFPPMIEQREGYSPSGDLSGAEQPWMAICTVIH